MRLPALLSLMLLIVGCNNGSQRIDRAQLDQRYRETQLAEGVLSVVPLHWEHAGRPPVVVNWWYAGTRDGEHHLIFRQLTWDNEGKPIGNELRYSISVDELLVTEPMPQSGDSARWVALYEAVSDEIEPPADLPTARKAPNPIDQNPVFLPDTVLPAED